MEIIGGFLRHFKGIFHWVQREFLWDSLGNLGGGEGVLKGSKRIYQSLDSLLGSLGDSLRIFSKFL